MAILTSLGSKHNCIIASLHIGQEIEDKVQVVLEILLQMMDHKNGAIFYENQTLCKAKSYYLVFDEWYVFIPQLCHNTSGFLTVRYITRARGDSLPPHPVGDA